MEVEDEEGPLQRPLRAVHTTPINLHMIQQGDTEKTIPSEVCCVIQQRKFPSTDVKGSGLPWSCCTSVITQDVL